MEKHKSKISDDHLKAREEEVRSLRSEIETLRSAVNDHNTDMDLIEVCLSPPVVFLLLCLLLLLFLNLF